jgi:hypothetical protein
MRKLILTVALFCPLLLFAQVNFQDISFEAALVKAKETGKLIFLQVESLRCEQCNDVASKAFCIKLTAEEKERKRVLTKYARVGIDFGIIFFSSDGSPVHTYLGSSTQPSKYEDEGNIALTKASEGTMLAAFENQYKEGNKSPGLMEFLIQKKKSLGYPVDVLLNEYVISLPADSLKSIRVLSIILSQSPVLESVPSFVLHQDKNLFEKTIQTIPQSDRKGIIESIGFKSIYKAAREKDENFAKRIAEFMKSSCPHNSTEGERAYGLKMLDFYKISRDTATFIAQALLFYDKYYMSVHPDSVRKADRDSLNSLKPLKSDLKDGLIKRSGDTLTYRSTIKFVASTQLYANALKNAASDFYSLTNNPEYLLKAITWAIKANEFYELYNTNNVLANLYIKTGQMSSAIEAKEKELLYKKKMGFNTKDLELEIEKLKNQ